MRRLKILVQEFENLRTQISSLEEQKRILSTEIKKVLKRRKDAKAIVQTTNGRFSLSFVKTEKSIVDQAKLIEAGFDLDKFSKKISYETLIIKNTQEGG